MSFSKSKQERSVFSDKLHISKDPIKEYSWQLSSTNLSPSAVQQPYTLLVKKQREIQHEQKIYQQWKDKRARFYEEKINTESNSHQITQETFDIVDQQYRKKLRECLPLQFLINNKITNLKYLCIDYQLHICQRGFENCCYSISAFELFKAIHQNKDLIQASIQGVEVQQFSWFMQFLNSIEEYEEDQSFSWMKSFNSFKSIKLAINTEVAFNLSKKEEILLRSNDLKHFLELFLQVSDISIVVGLQRWDLIKDWEKTLLQIWKTLEQIKKFKLQISGPSEINFITIDLFSEVRSVVFGQLASFTEITHLSLKRIYFGFDIANFYDFLPLQTNMNTFSLNNNLNHLELENCYNFLFLQTNMLQTISLWGTSFIKQQQFMSKLIAANSNIKFIKYSYMEQWSIDEKLFDQLQHLFVQHCSIINIDVISNSPSNIKHLKIEQCGINSQVFLMLFPKLFNLKYLYVSQGHFSQQVLCSIPSQLQQLHIFFNDIIKDQDLIKIDEKWPNLKHMTLSYFKYLTEQVWLICKFKGLMELDISSSMIKNNKILNELKRRGIKVNI